MKQVGGLFVLMAVGVILADLVANPQGTGTLFCHITNIWNTSVGGMLGQTTKNQDCTPKATPNGPKPPASQQKPNPPPKKPGCVNYCFFYCICI